MNTRAFNLKAALIRAADSVLAVTDISRRGCNHTAFQEMLVVAIVLSVWLVVFSLVSETPQTLIAMHWPIIVVAFFAATVANATAVGGGFIFLPFFSFYYGITSVESLKLALSTQAFGMSSGAVHWRIGNILKLPCFSACIGGGLGMLVGTYFLQPDVLQWTLWQGGNDAIHIAFGFVSVLIGIALLAECVLVSPERRSSINPDQRQLVNFGVLCVLGGVINAWVSIGIGELVALWLYFRWHFTLTQAIATGVVVLAFCSLLGFLFHAGLGGIPWHYLAFTIPGVILGGRAGAKLGARLAENKYGKANGSSLRVLVAAVIFLDGLVVLYFAL